MGLPWQIVVLARLGAEMVGAGVAATVMVADPLTVPVPQPLLTEESVYWVVVVGETVKLVVIAVTLIRVWPSDNVTKNGGAPTRATDSVADWPLWIVVLPLSVAVGRAVIVKGADSAPCTAGLVATTRSLNPVPATSLGKRTTIGLVAPLPNTVLCPWLLISCI
jgi:hypothetical protein